MSENENMKRKLFNAHCAKTMGYYRGQYSAGDFYFENQNEMVCPVDKYDPYNDLVLMMPVVDALCSGLGLHLNSGTVQRRGLLEAARELILSSILSDEDKENLGIEDILDITKEVVEEVGNMAEHEKLYKEMLAPHPLNNVPEFDDLYHKLKDISDSFQFETILPHAPDNKAVIKGCVGKERFWETDAKIDALPTPIHEGNCTNFGYDAVQGYPNVKDEQEKFNSQCREIMFEHSRAQGGSLTLAQNYDPYYNANETINIFEIVLQYLPPSITFTILGRAEYDCPSDQDILKRMQDFIRLYGKDEYMLPPAVAFNKICATLVKGYNVFDCQPIDDLFDPYNNIEDLAPIIPIVARRVGESFTLGEIMYDLPREDSYNMDLFDNMRHYVQRHGRELLDILENNE